MDPSCSLKHIKSPLELSTLNPFAFTLIKTHQHTNVMQYYWVACGRIYGVPQTTLSTFQGNPGMDICSAR